jgi:hypothetical protein
LRLYHRNGFVRVRGKTQVKVRRFVKRTCAYDSAAAITALNHAY